MCNRYVMLLTHTTSMFQFFSHLCGLGGKNCVFVKMFSIKTGVVIHVVMSMKYICDSVFFNKS